MQTQTPDGVVLSCDFCGTVWQPDGSGVAMIEGHKGSILCVDCLSRAVKEAAVPDTQPACTLCLQTREDGGKVWRHPDQPSEANMDAVLCWDCIQQADRTLGKDEDVDYERQISPSKRWR